VPRQAMWGQPPPAVRPSEARHLLASEKGIYPSSPDLLESWVWRENTGKILGLKGLAGKI